VQRTRLLLLLLLALSTAAATACKTRWDIEDRETTAEVWLEAPAAAQSEVTIPVTVYVGEHLAIDRAVRFPRGQTRVAAAPVYLKSGTHEVSVRVAGREVARGGAVVRHHAWILVRFVGEGATIQVLDREPGTR
jgi:hypothetical protein